MLASLISQKDRKMRLKNFRLGRIVRVKRIDKGLSMHNLGMLLGYKGGQVIYNLEHGVTNFPSKKILKLAEILDIPTSGLKMAMVEDYANSINTEIFGE